MIYASRWIGRVRQVWLVFFFPSLSLQVVKVTQAEKINSNEKKRPKKKRKERERLNMRSFGRLPLKPSRYLSLYLSIYVHQRGLN